MILSLDAPLWCYDNEDLAGEGYCRDFQQQCESDRVREVKQTALMMCDRQKLDCSQQSGIDVAMRASSEMWRACRESQSAACFAFEHRVDGIHSKLCYPNIAACDRGLHEAARDPDVAVNGQQRCNVFRMQ